MTKKKSYAKVPKKYKNMRDESIPGQWKVIEGSTGDNLILISKMRKFFSQNYPFTNKIFNN